MLMKYVPFFTDMLDDHFEDLTDEEVGLIVRAALAYAADGTEPEFERRSVLGLTWKRFKAHVDQCVARSENMSANGSKGGRPKKQEKASESKEKPKKASKSKNNHEQEQEQEHEQEQEQMQEQEHISAYPREATASASAPNDRIIAFDGTDIAEDIRRHDLAESMIRQYNVNPSEPTLVALIEDLEKHGEARMREVLNTAALSDTRGKVTVQYWRTILSNGSGKPRGKPPDGGAYMYRQYSDSDFKAMEVDLDAED